MKRADMFFRKCFDCGNQTYTKDIPKVCEKCGGTNLMSYEEYYMEEPYEEEQEVEIEESEEEDYE